MNTTSSKCPRSRTAIMTASGRYWDAMDPRPEWVWMPDVSHGLEIPRFNNQTAYPVTVASHLLRCPRMFVALESRFTEWMRAERLRFVDVALALMLHDAAEGYLGDRLGPLKTEADSAMEAATLAAIVRHLILDDARAQTITALALTCPLVKWFDKLACAHEAQLWQPGADDWAMPQSAGKNHGQLDPSEPVTMAELAPTIPCVWPRANEGWLHTVTKATRTLNEAHSWDGSLIDPFAEERAAGMLRAALR
jgi:hypothetical protein